jgi:transketolase
MKARVMRDVLIEDIYHRMRNDQRIFFLSADFGAPALDDLRAEFPDRFINVGIAEQNLINVATGLALEGFCVYAYNISGFATMRAYEQIRTNLSVMSETKELNVNLIAVGAGLSYFVSGPTHHCLEDLAIMRLFPHFTVFSPSDCILVENFMDFTVQHKAPKYIRLEGKPVLDIYRDNKQPAVAAGFHELKDGKDTCLVATGYMTHKAMKVAQRMRETGRDIGVVDLFLLKPIDKDVLFEVLKKYRRIVTIEEAFINSGGLDSLIAEILTERGAGIELRRMGFKDKYVFDLGSRDRLHELHGLGEDAIIRSIWTESDARDEKPLRR